MKRIILSLAAVLSFVSAMAQTYWDTQRSERPVTFGVRAGINSSKQYATDIHADQDSRIGFQFGLEADINIIRSFSINTGVMLIQRGWKNSYSDSRGKLETKDNAMYVEVPVLGSYRVKLSDQASFQLNLGPYFAYGVSGKTKTTNTFGQSYSYNYDSFDKDRGCKRFDVGVHLGTGITYHHIFAGISYERGLVNAWQQANYEYQNGTIAFTMGYNF